MQKITIFSEFLERFFYNVHGKVLKIPDIENFKKLNPLGKYKSIKTGKNSLGGGEK